MKYRNLLLTSLALLLFSILGGVNIYEGYEVICRVPEGQDPDQVAASVNAMVISRIDEARLYLFRSDSSTAESMLLELQQNPEAYYAQPNYLIQAFDYEQVSQPFVDVQSEDFIDGESPQEFYHQPSVNAMQVNRLSESVTGQGVTIAVIDGGLDLNHELFAGRIDSASYDFVSDDSSPWITSGDPANHGTCVAGIIARGAPQARLLILRSFPVGGDGNSFALAKSIYYAIEHGADIINMSFGMTQIDGIIEEALAAASDAGVILICSAGNTGTDRYRFPAFLSNVISVAAVDSLDRRAYFSSFGPHIDLAAPGTSIYGPLCGENWGWWEGTSFSAAYVSGLAALIRQVQPGFTASQVIARIKATAVDINDMNPGFEYQLGEGRIDYFTATYITGDANRGGDIDLADAVFISNYLFNQQTPPEPVAAGDADCSASINVSDVTKIINYVVGLDTISECQE
jgi:subtilisin family serine protease